MNRTYRRIAMVMVVGAVVISFAFGVFVANYHERIGGVFHEPFRKIKPETGLRVTPETPIIMEKTYSKCRHKITSGYERPEELVGRTLDQLQQEFTYKGGYLLWFDEDGSLVIHQQIDDWCPDDQERVHLGLFKGQVAVFKGPKGFSDELLRVTGIRAELLPEQLLQDLEAGILEYTDEDEANFVLENLDEYD